MCTVCAELRPWATDCGYAGLDGAGLDGAGLVGAGTARAAAGLETLAPEEIAQRLLTHGWGIEEPRSFRVESGGALSVDVGALAPEGRELARAALAEWSTVTGIRFEEIDGFRFGGKLSERGDAPGSTATGVRLGLDEAFDGRIGSGDRDWVRFELAQGQTARIEVEGTGGSALSAPGLALFAANGKALRIGAQHSDREAAVTVSATKGGGTYYAQVSGLGGKTGDYRLSITEPGGGASADIVFSDDAPGAVTQFTHSGDRILDAEVNVSREWLEANGTGLASYSFHTYLHEIGHALGLGHPAPYGRGASFGAHAEYANDSWQTSVMSYFNQAENPLVGDDKAYVLTPMIGDVEAVRHLYGEASVRAGDTVYGEGSTAEGALDAAAGASRAVAFTLVDTGGRDRMELSSQRAAQSVDLREGAVSDVFGHEGNMVVALGTVIEDARLGAGDDHVRGNAASNDLRGGGGADRIWSHDGRDSVHGGAGADRLWGGSGNDRLKGGSGGDRIWGEGHDDTLLGGSGDDALFGGEGADTLRGHSGKDRLTGGTGDDRLSGGRHDDRIKGQRGEDRMWGEEGRDRLQGGPGDDYVHGGEGRDKLWGGDGRDRLDGGGDADRLTGGGGADRFLFEGRFGRDVVRDFDPRSDRIDLSEVSAVRSWSDLSRNHLRERHGDAVIDAGDSGRIVLRGVDADEIGADDFLF